MGLFGAIGRGLRKVGGAALGVGASLVPGGSLARTAVSTVAGGLLGRGSMSRPVPTMPRLVGGGGGGVPRVPQGGVVGTVRRVLPGGRSGYTYDPFDLNTPTDRTGRPVAVIPEMRERVSCPPGYVGVDLDGDGVKDACVLKGVARAMGLYHSRPKPPVSGYEARAIRTATAAKKRVASLARSTGLYVAARKPQSGGGKKK